jgi:hypothetical protein
LGKALFAKISRGRHGRDRMVAVFTTTCAISSYRHKVVNSNPVHSEVYSIQHYLIKFVSDLRFSQGTTVSSTNKTDSHDIAEILFKSYVCKISHLDFSAQKHNLNLSINDNCIKLFISSMKKFINMTTIESIQFQGRIQICLFTTLFYQFLFGT